MTLDITVDKEFSALCSPLTAEERSTLEQQIKSDGCRDSLLLWRENGHLLLLDGHNRLDICNKNKITYRTLTKHFSSREDARNFVIANQLGRRNLTEIQKEYLRGKRYIAEKQSQGGQLPREKGCAQNGHTLPAAKGGRTAEKLAAEYKVGYNTIKRDGKFAEAVDALAENTGDKTRRAILSGELKVTKQDVVKLAELPPQKQAAAIQSGPEGIRMAVAAMPGRDRRTIAEGRPSQLAVRAAIAALDQLVSTLERIKIAGRVARHVDAIRKELEDVRNSNS